MMGIVVMVDPDARSWTMEFAFSESWGDGTSTSGSFDEGYWATFSFNEDNLQSKWDELA